MKKQVKIGLGAAALALAAALCAGGTLAGWRTSSTVTNHISTATVQGIVEEKYEQGQTITPGQTVEKCVWVKNTGTASSLVRAKVVIDWDDETAADMDATDCVFPAYNTADWTQGEDGYWYYNDIVEPNPALVQTRGRTCAADDPQAAEGRKHGDAEKPLVSGE